MTARTTTRRSATVLAAVAGLALVSCGSADAESADTDPVATGAVATDAVVADEAATLDPGSPSAQAALAEGALPIDVRTPEEHAAGHVEGDTLMNIGDPGFDAAVAALDPAETYVVYCRSGNRSAQAAERMRAAGLTVRDGGALDDMLAAGWPPAS